jgi:hypothetical protein
MDRQPLVTFPALGSPSEVAPPRAAVVDNAASERRELPVDVEGDAQGARGFVNAISRKQHNWSSTRYRRGKMSVLGQQDPILFGTTRGEHTVRKPAFCNDSVVAGRTKPSAEAAQHLVAQEPRHLPDLS